MARLNKRNVEKLIKRKKRGLSSLLIAKQLGVSKRRINQVWNKYNLPGFFYLKKPGKLAERKLSEQELKAIFYLHENQKSGARIIAKLLRLRYKIKIGNNLVHKALLDNGRAMLNENKQKRRKPWIRYEREHSLSAGHMDWHTAKWCPDMQVCTVIDDSSRKILSAVECSNATEQESIKLVQQVINEYQHIRKIREIISDHGTQFFCNKPNENGELGKNEFQLFLESEGIKHILCRYKHPQSNGKQEKWFDTYERHRAKFKTLNEFVKWYNETRVHESLDLRTPEKVFWERLEPFLLEMVGKFFKEG